MLLVSSLETFPNRRSQNYFPILGFDSIFPFVSCVSMIVYWGIFFYHGYFKAFVWKF